MADELNNGQQVQSTEGHELELITVAGLKAALQKFKTDIVDPMQWPMLPVAELPTASANTMHKLYFVPSPNPEENNEKDEFITLETIVEGQSTYNWELIGSTAIDLSNYATLQAVEDAFAAVHADGVAVVTLSSAPTSSTTTYTKDGLTINFKVSDEVRVADTEQSTEGSHGYVYYKLYDLVNGVAYWDLIGSGGENVLGEITVSITTYVNDIASSSSLLGNVTVTLTNLTDGGTPQTATWSGTDVTFSGLTPLKDYRVSIEDKTGWLRDKSNVDITSLGIAEQESASFSYSADEYTCVVSGTSDGRIVVSGTEYANGATFRVSKGTSITATAKAVTNFETPTATITNKTISAVYVAYGYVTVSTSSNQGTDSTIAAVTPTIKIGNAAAVSYTAPVQVAPSTQVVITWPAVTGYKAPAQITFTKNGTTDETKSGEYQTELVTVTVDTDETGVTAEGQIITINGSNYTVGASGVVTAKVAFDTVYSVSANSWSGQDDYTTPESQTNITAAIASRSITMTYLKIRGTLYSLVVTDNQNGDSGAATNANVTVKYIKDNIETILGTTFKNGDTFLIPNGATNIEVTGSDITNFAADVTVSGTTYTVTYKAQKVTVSISGGGSGLTVTLKDTTKNATVLSSTSSFTGYVAWGDSWYVEAVATTSLYPVISPSSGTANSTSASVSVTMTSYTLITSGEADLGLPSGKLWAAANVGASNYYDDGLYFSWGDTTGHALNSGYNFSESNYNSGVSGSGHNLTGNIPSGNATYDAARANMGGSWRMPTYDEYTELINNCTCVWATLNGVYGLLVVGNGKGIFLPASGAYQNTSLDSYGSGVVYWCTAHFDDYGFALNSTINPQVVMTAAFIGASIRAIKDPEFVDLDLPSGVKWARSNLQKTSGSTAALCPNETDYGDFWSWANVGLTTSTGWMWSTGNPMTQTMYDSTTGKNCTWNIPATSASYNVAYKYLGAPWRLPTKTEFQELIDNTDREWTTINNVNGWKFMKKTDHSVYVFFPASGVCTAYNSSGHGSTGYYWSSTYIYSSSYSEAYCLYFTSSYTRSSKHERYKGLSIRPIQ